MTLESLLEDPAFRAIVDQFVGELPTRVSAIRLAVAEGRWDDAERLAHHLKGAGGGFGFDELTAASADAERCASDRDTQKWVTAIDELESVCTKVTARWSELRRS